MKLSFYSCYGDKKGNIKMEAQMKQSGVGEVCVSVGWRGGEDPTIFIKILSTHMKSERLKKKKSM